ncbi:MAG TPA: substrate-binding domain-containing protein, partial [Chloroflexota bacterium]|nr:substrate-binding domain-containing protein [Chloroflexota bacterium]
MTHPLPSGGHHERRLGLAYESSANLFFRDLAEGVREAAAACGATISTRESGQSAERQLADVTALLDEGIDALLIAPIDPSAVAPALAEAQRRGVPVFTVDRAAPGCRAISHVTSDNVLGGRLAADLLSRLLEARQEVAIVTMPGATSTIDRVRGFRESLAAHESIHVVDEVNGGSNRQRAREATAALLGAYPRLAGIFAVNDVMAMGVLDAVREAARQESVIVVGYDATPQGCEEILRGGPLKGEVAQFPARLGQQVVALWADYERGVTVPELVEIPVELVTAENVDRFTGAERLVRVRRGDVRVAGERVIFFPVRGYQMMLNEIHAASPDLQRHIVYRSGFVLGESIADQIREIYTDPHDRLFVLLEDLSRSGFGSFELLSLDLHAGRAEVRGHDLFEASIANGLTWARTPRCVDNYRTGRLAGYLTAIFGRPAVCEEIS